jgi:signal transduction histidine kinase
MSGHPFERQGAAALVADHAARLAVELPAPLRHGLRGLVSIASHYRWFLLLVPLYALALGGARALPLAIGTAAAATLYSSVMAAAERRWPDRLARHDLFFRCFEIILICVGLSLIPGQGADGPLYQAGIYTAFVVFAAVGLGPRAVGWPATCAAAGVGIGITLIAAQDPAVMTSMGSEYLASAALFTVALWLSLLAIGLIVSSRSVTRAATADPAVAVDKLPTYSRINEISAHRERLAIMGEVTAQIIHYLSSPLTGISTIVDDLLEDCSDRERGSLELVKSEADRASAVVRELLAFTRRDEDNPVVSLNEITDRALDLFVFRERSGNIFVSRELSEEPVDVRIGPSQLEQVVLNLLDNALQAINGSGPGTICVRTRSNGDRVVLEVSDSGPGIPKEIEDRIFEPFFTTKEPGIGTGLGLAIVSSIVRDCGGEISVKSQPGRGATFTISFQKAE